MLKPISLSLLCAALLVTLWTPAAPAQGSAFPATMKAIVDRLRDAHDPQQLLTLDSAQIEAAITDRDWEVLATEYWTFTANVPVVVSVMRHVDQEVTPFWLSSKGFQKTDLRVRNESYEYEVWQKTFPAGRVGLGINGFDKHRPHYFVAVGPQEPGAEVRLTDFYPANQVVLEMREGSTIYHDWSELVLTEVPESLQGHVLLPTLRGRARDAHLIGAFRETPYPSSPQPDQIALTWSDDPRTTQSVQWRTDTSVEEGRVRYWPSADGQPDSPEEAVADRVQLDDGFIVNDRSVHRFTATLRGLSPSTSYTYRVGSPDGAWSEPAEFSTAPEGEAPFTFVWLSDTHNKQDTDALLEAALTRYPESAFCAISGDLVGTGQYRDDWDSFFRYGAAFYRQRPVLPAIGNHDALDGLGVDLYLAHFALPQNGPDFLEPERSYTLEYGNALFVILDATAPIEEQASWLEARLAESDALWKFAMFHFPPYSSGEGYPDIRAAWGPHFDRHQVDYVLAGHVHYYMRTHPLKGDERVSPPDHGTTYLITVSVPSRGPRAKPDYAASMGTGGQPLYHVFSIDGHRLIARSHDAEGRINDEWTAEKDPDTGAMHVQEGAGEGAASGG